MWDLPRPGLEPMSPALAGGFLTTAPPGKPQDLLLIGNLADMIFLLVRNLSLGPGDEMIRESSNVKCHQGISTEQPWACMCAPSCSYTNTQWAVGLLFYFQGNSACPIPLLRNVFLTLLMWFGHILMDPTSLAYTDWSRMGVRSVLGQLEHFPGFQTLGWEKVRHNIGSCCWLCFLS